MKQHTILTEEGYQDMVKSVSDEVFSEHKPEIREHIRNPELDVNDLSGTTLETIRHKCRFHEGHPSDLGISYVGDMVYLASILQHSSNSRYTGFAGVKPGHPEEALTEAALYCFVRDVKDELYPSIRQYVKEEKAKVDGR